MTHLSLGDAMKTTVLEDRLSANPKSPLFARLASSYLKEGRAERAIAICIDGLKTFPEYSTAHLVLGQSYEALGRNVEAIVEYRRVLNSVPDNFYVKGLLHSAEEREREAFRAFAEERARKLTQRGDRPTAKETYRETSVANEGSAEDEGQAHHPGHGVSKIVTATLAEIYASQGEFGEAIQAYRRLVEERPVESERYTKRIAELEDLAREQRTEAGA